MVILTTTGSYLLLIALTAFLAGYQALECYLDTLVERPKRSAKEEHSNLDVKQMSPWLKRLVLNGKWKKLVNRKDLSTGIQERSTIHPILITTPRGKFNLGQS